ncbi:MULTISPECIES: pyroglutamyl-peptidase I [unclassified Arthrobacter]|uniref:pyroglutamyl-peptidase I n=1 Tax=unclassified Arthrobacter TaxID=235627 RepID=UPI002E017F7F|nr:MULTISPECIES: pyroglutamyl-peptidase I [unclassified Arthrobacter]MEC5190611.1 pyroglutamyl-peptidase [Arthrobacter sp. MP_M4]MEC5201962.1 pyroglutamyl-peptidase [Arthrobacter sp. MP_M7]
MILLTGFEPFGGESTNPSWSAAREAAARLRAEGLDARAVELPCVFGEATRVLEAALDHYGPDLVVCAGQAGGRPRISLERIAINCDDARIPDNAGNSPVDQAVVSGGPAAYFSTLPVKAVLTALLAAGIPAEVSQTAGTYVCNHLFYGLMHALRHRPGTRGGFVHVPYEPAQLPPGSNQPSLTLEHMTEALAAVVRTTLGTTADLKIAAGTTH